MSQEERYFFNKCLPKILLWVCVFGLPFVCLNIAYSTYTGLPAYPNGSDAGGTGMDVAPNDTITSDGQDNHSQILLEIEDKLSYGASTPNTDQCLCSTGTDTSGWSEVPDGAISSDVTRDAEWDTVTKINTATGETILTTLSSAIPASQIASGGISSDNFNNMAVKNQPQDISNEWKVRDSLRYCFGNSCDVWLSYDAATDEQFEISADSSSDMTVSFQNIGAGDMHVIADSVSARPSTNPTISLTDIDGDDVSEPHFLLTGNLTSTPSTDEDMDFDLQTKIGGVYTSVFGFDASANEADMGTVALVTTGVISGAIRIPTFITDPSYTMGTDHPHESYGSLMINGDDDTVELFLEPVAAGMNLCLSNDEGVSGTIFITAEASDFLILDGIKSGSGESVRSIGGGAGDFICVVGTGNENWLVLGKQGTWGIP